MKIPKSMKAELMAWNNSEGINLESWIGCSGSFSLAIGYSTIFWPSFVEYKGYILREGFSKQSLIDFEKQRNGNRKSVEIVMNHFHIADIQYFGCEDISKDKIMPLGKILKEIYEAKLKWQFPDKPCIVSFYQPEDANDLMAYEISFWQKKHEQSEAT